MDIGRVFSRSFGTLTRNFKIAVPFFLEYLLDILATVFLLLSALVALGASFMSMAGGDMEVLMYRILTAHESPPLEVVGVIIFLVLLTLVFLIGLRGASLAATVGMSHDALSRGGTSYTKGFDAVRAHVGSIMVYFLLVGLMVGAMAIGAFIPAVVGAVIGSVLLTQTLSIFGFIVAFLGGIGVLLGSVFTPQQIVIENVGAVEGMKKSFVFVKDHLFDVILYGVASVAIFFVTFMVFAYVFQPLMILARGDFAATALQLFQNLLSTALSLAMVAFFEVVQTAMVMEGKRPTNGKDI